MFKIKKIKISKTQSFSTGYKGRPEKYPFKQIDKVGYGFEFPVKMCGSPIHYVRNRAYDLAGNGKKKFSVIRLSKTSACVVRTK